MLVTFKITTESGRLTPLPSLRAPRGVSASVIPIFLL